VEVRAGVQALGGAAYQVGTQAGSERLELGQGMAGQWVVSDGDGARHTLHYAQADGLLFVSLAGRQSVIRDLSLAPAQAAGGVAQQQIRAPMAGRIVSLAATVGAQVRKGDPLLALEAMKMEHPSVAPMAATVKAVHVQVGTQVAAGMLLLELEPAA
jgi:biotin carboxyl carrier protein